MALRTEVRLSPAFEAAVVDRLVHSLPDLPPSGGGPRERFITWRRPGGRTAGPGETMDADAKPVQTPVSSNRQLERPSAAARGANRGGE
jgi:hypothetical protein